MPNRANTKELDVCGFVSLLALLLHESQVALQAALQFLALCNQQQVLIKSLILLLTFLSDYRSTDRVGCCLPCIHDDFLFPPQIFKNVMNDALYLLGLNLLPSVAPGAGELDE